MNKSSDISRRNFLRLAGGLGAGLIIPRYAWIDKKRSEVSKFTAAIAQSQVEKADFTIRIASVIVEVAKDRAISTIGYNSTVPGPVLRMREGVPSHS
ncbi:MAG: hypothetical protein ACM3SR_02430 [Ignavibacteriales bacterium]